MSPLSTIWFAVACVCMRSLLEAEKDGEEDEEGKELFFSTIYPRRSVILHFIL